MKIRTSPMRYTVAGPVAAIALTAASLSACGGAPSGSNTTNVCTLVPSSQVAAIAGKTVVQAIPEQLDSLPDPDSFLCTYDLNDGQKIQVEVEVTSSPDTFAANSRFVDADGVAPAASAPGVGDKAAAGANGLAVLTGKDNILVSGVPGELHGDHAGDIKLATILISALG